MSNYSLEAQDYTVKNVLGWGLCIKHCQIASISNGWNKVVHYIIALTEALPVVSQIVSFIEFMAATWNKSGSEQPKELDGRVKPVDNDTSVEKVANEQGLTPPAPPVKTDAEMRLENLRKLSQAIKNHEDKSVLSSLFSQLSSEDLRHSDALMIAISSGNLDALLELHCKGLDKEIFTRTINGKTFTFGALYQAAILNQNEVVDYLIGLGMKLEIDEHPDAIVLVQDKKCLWLLLNNSKDLKTLVNRPVDQFSFGVKQTRNLMDLIDKYSDPKMFYFLIGMGGVPTKGGSISNYLNALEYSYHQAALQMALNPKPFNIDPSQALEYTMIALEKNMQTFGALAHMETFGKLAKLLVKSGARINTQSFYPPSPMETLNKIIAETSSRKKPKEFDILKKLKRDLILMDLANSLSKVVKSAEKREEFAKLLKEINLSKVDVDNHFGLEEQNIIAIAFELVLDCKLEYLDEYSKILKKVFKRSKLNFPIYIIKNKIKDISDTTRKEKINEIINMLDKCWKKKHSFFPW